MMTGRTLLSRCLSKEKPLLWAKPIGGEYHKEGLAKTYREGSIKGDIWEGISSLL
jgi:hypothetical protein